MRPELRSKLTAVMRGAFAEKQPVTTVTPVTSNHGYWSKPLKLPRLPELLVENSKGGKSAKGPVTEPVTSSHELDPVDLEERKAMAADSVPSVYLDGWARLQCQKPAGIIKPRWQQAIEDAGCFLDAWGQLAATFGWAPDDLFAAPDNRSRMGLVWWLNGRNVTALGPEHACAGEPAYDRLTRSEWRNPYKEKRR